MFILQHPKKNFRIHSKFKQPSMADWERKRESSDLGCPCQEYQKANRAVFMLFDTLFALFSTSSCSTDTNSKKSSFALIMDLQPQMCVCFSLVSFPGFFFLIYFPGFKARPSWSIIQLNSLYNIVCIFPSYPARSTMTSGWFSKWWEEADANHAMIQGPVF